MYDIFLDFLDLPEDVLGSDFSVFITSTLSVLLLVTAMYLLLRFFYSVFSGGRHRW